MPVVGVREGRIHDFNAAARELFGNLQTGALLEVLFEESCRTKLRTFVREAVCGSSVELEVIQSDRPPVAAHFLLLATPGELLLVGTTTGVDYRDAIGVKLMAANTSLANLTRELSRRMYELDTANRAIRELADVRELFISALAHDLKGPLSTILFSESLLRTRAPALPAIELSPHCERVERSAKQMLQLIDSLLFAAQLDSAESLAAELREEVNLAELAHECAEDLAALAEVGSVQIVVTASERVRLRGHRAWLRQVIVNLLSNAIRHSPAGERIDLIVAADGSTARCEVVDRGPGVPVGDRERIFDRFVQRGERRGSVGLGLYISRKVVELHGGRIWVEDNAGGGARFVFEIPG